MLAAAEFAEVSEEALLLVCTAADLLENDGNHTLLRGRAQSSAALLKLRYQQRYQSELPTHYLHPKRATAESLCVDGAAVLLEKALSAFQPILGRTHPETVSCRMNQALCNTTQDTALLDIQMIVAEVNDVRTDDTWMLKRCHDVALDNQLLLRRSEGLASAPPESANELGGAEARGGTWENAPAANGGRQFSPHRDSDCNSACAIHFCHHSA